MDDAEGKEEVLDFVEGLQNIYSDTNIMEADTAYDATLDALSRSNATYRRFRSDYEQSREDLEKAREVFEDALEERKQWQIAKLLIKFLSQTANAAAGEKTPEDDKKDKAKTFVEDETFSGMTKLLIEITAIVKQINDLADKAGEIIDAVSRPYSLLLACFLYSRHAIYIILWFSH